MASDTNIPIEPGYYWHRDVDPGDGAAYEWEVLCVEKNSRFGLRVEDTSKATSRTPEEIGGEWGARISDPEEKSEVVEDAARFQVNSRDKMNLRDVFAGFALIGFLANASPNRPTHDCQSAAQIAYNYADAMIEEREKRDALIQTKSARAKRTFTAISLRAISQSRTV